MLVSVKVETSLHPDAEVLPPDAVPWPSCRSSRVCKYSKMCATCKLKIWLCISGLTSLCSAIYRPARRVDIQRPSLLHRPSTGLLCPQVAKMPPSSLLDANIITEPADWTCRRPFVLLSPAWRTWSKGRPRKVDRSVPDWRGRSTGCFEQRCVKWTSKDAAQVQRQFRVDICSDPAFNRCQPLLQYCAKRWEIRWGT
mgnify:CR=1 FL=1